MRASASLRFAAAHSSRAAFSAASAAASARAEAFSRVSNDDVAACTAAS